MAEYLDEIPAAKSVSLHDIYRVIAGHSYYHGDRILAALTCIAEGKEVNPVRPADAVLVVHGRWIYDKKAQRPYCSICKKYFYGATNSPMSYCSNCGAKMDGDDNNAST